MGGACQCERSAVTWPEVSGIEPAIIGGVVLEHAGRAKARFYEDRHDRDNMTYWAIVDGLDAVRRGDHPAQAVDRLPPWIVSVLRARLADHSVHWLDTSFQVTRVLELAGLIELVVDETYVLAMLTGLIAEQSEIQRAPGDPVDWFRADPDLIERAYWRAFLLEGAGAISIRVGSWRDASPWREATLTMIAEQMIPRERVIDACLSALAQDFASAAARWYVGTLAALEPSIDELDERQPRLRRLIGLRSPVITPAVLVWLRRLDGAGRLDDAPTATALAPAISSGPKATALNGLRLLTRIQRRDGTLDVISAASGGLGHPHSDVQRAAARLVLLAGGRDIVLAEAESLDPSVRRELDIPLAAEVVTRPLPVDTHPSQPTEVPRERAAGGSDHDVVERLAALLEDPSDADGVELVLDRLARSAAADLLEPLTKRARAVLMAGPGNWEGDDRLQNHLADLVLAAVNPVAGAATAGPPAPAASGSRFLQHRIAEVRRVVVGESPPGPLLALPTDPTGWLEPEAFTHRLRRGHPPGRFDLIAALLRLAGSDRSTARDRWLSSETSLPPELDRPIRYALGEDPPPDVDLRDRALWVAASRSVHPLDDDRLLITHGLNGAGQGRPLHGAIAFGYQADQITPLPGITIDLGTQADYNITFDHPVTTASTSRSRRDSWWTGNQRPISDQPTAFSDVARELDRPREAWPTWLATLWPHDAESFAVTAFDAAFDLILWQSKDLQPYRTVSALKNHPGRQGPIAHTTFALGLNAAALDARIVAVDHIIELIGRRRLATPDLAVALAATLPVAVLTRWADSLRRLADAGHPDLSIDLMSAVLPHVPTGTRGVHALLDVLHQELLRTGRTTPDTSLRTHLATFSGSSKSARSARAILDIV